MQGALAASHELKTTAAIFLPSSFTATPEMRKNRIVPAALPHHIACMKTSYVVFETELGFAGIIWSDAGVARFQLPSASADATARNLLRRSPDATPAEPPAHIAEIVEAMKRYFAGERIDFSDVTLDLAGQDDLFRAIYAAARRIGYGETTTYGGLAKAIGRTDWEGARDVGQAMAKNPVALIIPCHRVLAAGGKIGGFSAPGGAATKAKMLALEGVQRRPEQQSLGL
jgi:methylated-DNA-[protein]-cysteine S-methyltransferase